MLAKWNEISEGLAGPPKLRLGQMAPHFDPTQSGYRVFRKSLQQGSWTNKQKRPRSCVFGAKTFGKLCKGLIGKVFGRETGEGAFVATLRRAGASVVGQTSAVWSRYGLEA